MFHANRAPRRKWCSNASAVIWMCALLNYQDGPAPLRQLLRKAQERLDEIAQASIGEGVVNRIGPGLMKQLRALSE